MSQRNNDIYIAPSPLHGSGVFCARFITEGEVIEICPVIILPKKELPWIKDSVLYDYYFIWGKEDDCLAIILGYGSIYNHSYKPNAEYFPDHENGTLSYYAYKDIPPGEEILVNYNGDPSDDTKVWFEKAN